MHSFKECHLRLILNNCQAGQENNLIIGKPDRFPSLVINVSIRYEEAASWSAFLGGLQRAPLTYGTLLLDMLPQYNQSIGHASNATAFTNDRSHA